MDCSFVTNIVIPNCPSLSFLHFIETASGSLKIGVHDIDRLRYITWTVQRL